MLKIGEFSRLSQVPVKTLEPQRVISVRDVIPTYSQQGELWSLLGAYLGRHRVTPAGPCLTIYYEEGYTETNVDAEACWPVSGSSEPDGRVQVRDLPGGLVACVVHHGPFASLTQAYDALIPWIERNGYRIAGPGQEIYLQTKGDGDQNDPNTVTEVQFPVERAG